MYVENIYTDLPMQSSPINVGLNIPLTCNFRKHPSYTRNEHEKPQKILPNFWHSLNLRKLNYFPLYYQLYENRE